MPDKRQHRGPHPSDAKLFAPRCVPALRAGVADYSWLLSRGYAPPSGLKLVGDRHGLSARQRLAVMRSACSDDARLARQGRRVWPSGSGPAAETGDLAIDGYNLLITVESALSGGVLLVGRDGCLRDLASVHGTYRHVRETEPALTLILDELARMPLSRATWYFDRPVSNSGRLRARLSELIAARVGAAERVGAVEWRIELVNNPDQALLESACPVISSDSVVLDRCGPWLNFAAEVIRRRIGDAWVVDLSDSPGGAGL